MGVCSIYEEEKTVITCPIRFRQNWIIADDAAAFFFPKGTKWTSLTEIRLEDKSGRAAGNIDLVLVSYDQNGRVTDFGALEIQAVYISGNIRKPFEFYMENPKSNQNKSWTGRYYPRPDYLSSSRKRLAPQLIYKGGILHAWGKKIAVAVDRHFFSTLPSLIQVEPNNAEIAWLIYDLQFDEKQKLFNLVKHKTLLTSFAPSLKSITTTEPGSVGDFVELLQEKLNEKLNGGHSPDAPTLLDIMEK